MSIDITAMLMNDALLMVNYIIVKIFNTILFVTKCLIANAIIVVQSNHRRLDDKTQAAFGIARVLVNAMNAATAIDKITHAKVQSPAWIAIRSCISEKSGFKPVSDVVVSDSLPI